MSTNNEPQEPRHALTPRSQQPPLSDELIALAHAAYELGQDSVLERSSRDTYNVFQRHYLTFCSRHNISPLDEGSVVTYIAACFHAGEAGSTLEARVAAIKRLAIETKQPDPTLHVDVRKVLRGAVRLTRTGKPEHHGAPAIPARPVRRVEPLTIELLALTVKVIDDRKIRSYATNERLRLRDRALMLFCFALARRGAEVADLTFDDIEELQRGWRVRFRWSKTNKSGEAEYVGIPSFPDHPLDVISAMKAYHAAEGIHVGSLFRTVELVRKRKDRRGGDNPMTRQDIARRVEQIAKYAGLEGRWRSHSFRRGHVTSAEQRSVARSRININTGWKSDAMYKNYAQHDDVIEQSPLHEIYGLRAALDMPLFKKQDNTQG